MNISASYGKMSIKNLKTLAYMFAACLLCGFILPNDSAYSREAQNGTHYSIITWRHVVDQQGSSLDVPSNMTQAYDGNAWIFRSNDHQLIVRFWTMTEERGGFPGHDPSGDMNLKRVDCDKWPPEYYKVSNKLAVYSCVIQNNIRYYLAKYNKSGGVAIMAKYPKAYDAQWSSVVARMALSLRQVIREPR